MAPQNWQKKTHKIQKYHQEKWNYKPLQEDMTGIKNVC